MKTPIDEVIDQYTVLKLKMEGIDAYLSPREVKKEKPILKKQFDLYTIAIEKFQKDGFKIKSWVDRLYRLNSKGRELESNIRRDLYKTLPKKKLEKIGKEMFRMVKVNTKRLEIKNKIAKACPGVESEIIEVPLAELIDRYTLLKLKKERVHMLTPDQVKNEKPQLKKKLAKYTMAIEELKEKGVPVKEKWIQQFYKYHKKIWDSGENKIRHNALGLAETGKKARELRKMTKKKIEIKNKIAEESGNGFRVVKILIK